MVKKLELYAINYLAWELYKNISIVFPLESECWAKKEKSKIKYSVLGYQQK